MATWGEHLPDYDLVLWNEDNVDLSHPFLEYAYSNKRWAFVSDYVRLKVLYEQGGIYLDTDMFVLKSFDNLLNTALFIGAERQDLVSCGIIGATMGHPVIKEALSYYSAHPLTERYFRLSIPRVITRAIEKTYPELGFPLDGVWKNGDQVVIYPPDYFYPIPFQKDGQLPKGFLRHATRNTYAIHLWAASWMDFSEFELIRKGHYSKGFQKLVQNLGSKTFTINYLRKLASSLKQSFRHD